MAICESWEELSYHSEVFEITPPLHSYTVLEHAGEYFDLKITIMRESCGALCAEKGVTFIRIAEQNDFTQV